MLKKLPQNSNKILILGCGGHAKVITEVAKSQGFCDFYYQDLNYKKKIEFNDLYVVKKSLKIAV